MNTPGEFGPTKRRLRNLYDEYRPIMHHLLKHNTFSVDDAPQDGREVVKVVLALKSEEAISQIGQQHRQPRYGGGCDDVNVWEWCDGVREWLRDVVEDRDELPCGHRAHIYHRDGGGYGCKYCDSQQDYDRETVRAVVCGD